MKLLYFFIIFIGLLFTGYLFVNNFTFDNTSFSHFLINSLFGLLLCSLVLGGIFALISYKRKHTYSGMMTIRQYYNYKSAR
jgi:hypothetical protein